MVRRLPVLPNSDDAVPKRPPWQRALIAAGFVVTLWLPASALFQLLGATGILFTLALAGFCSGMLTGRFVAATPKEAVYGGLLASAFLWIFAMLRNALPLWPVGLLTLEVIAGVVTLSSWLGAKSGQKTRTRDPAR
jgi:hypothetical protein